MKTMETRPPVRQPEKMISAKSGPAAVARIGQPLDERQMPRPWFSATTHQYAIGTILHVGSLGPPLETVMPSGFRRLGWLVLPPFQRPSVWTVEQKVAFIESAWAGLPLGVWVYNSNDRDDYLDAWLLDGQQRIGAILDYVAGRFAVNGFFWADLHLTDHRSFSMISFAGLRTQTGDAKQMEDIYNRLAYGGTPHELKG